MSFVQLSKVSLAFGVRDILKDVTLILTNGTKAALTGANGAGKSTLMKIIAGIRSFDDGEISLEKGTLVSYLPQHGIVHSGSSLYDEAEKAFTKAREILAEMDAVGAELERETNEAAQKRLAEKFDSLQVSLEESGWYRRESLIREVLAGLGFSSHDLSRLTDEFSGGWQMRIALAKILLQGADILILDEPTNYLDLEARNWLENYLRNFKGGFLLVSHDRYFLDTCVTETYELFNGKLTKYTGTYTKYEAQREQELAQIVKAYNEQQEEIKRTEDFIRRFRYNESKAAMVQDRIKRLEKLERIEIPEQFKKVKFKFPEAPHSGNIILKLEHISKCFGDKSVISDFNFILEKNERLVLAGKNGAGKSTLLRIMTGVDKDFEGSLTVGAGVDIGYFSQDSAEKLTSNSSVIELLESEAPLELIPNLRNMLAAFLFRGDDIFKSISVLSGGEKSRIALLRLLLKKHNLLVLELTPPSEENFLSASVIKNYPGTYDYYLYAAESEKTNARATIAEHSAADTQSKAANENANHYDASEAVNKKILSYAEQKELRAKRQKLEREEKALIAEIEKTETQIAEAQNSFSSVEVYSDAAKSKRVAAEIAALKSHHEKLLENWETLSKALGELMPPCK